MYRDPPGPRFEPEFFSYAFSLDEARSQLPAGSTRWMECDKRLDLEDGVGNCVDGRVEIQASPSGFREDAPARSQRGLRYGLSPNRGGGSLPHSCVYRPLHTYCGLVDLGGPFIQGFFLRGAVPRWDQKWETT